MQLIITKSFISMSKRHKITKPNEIYRLVFQCLLQSEMIDAVDTINLFATHEFMKYNLSHVKSIRFPLHAEVRWKFRHSDKILLGKVDHNILKSFRKFPLNRFYVRTDHKSKYDKYYNKYNCFNDDGLKIIADFSLKVLHIEDCDTIYDNGLYHLRKLKLNRLSFSGSRWFGYNGLNHLDFSQLTNLDVSQCSISDNELLQIGKAHQLTFLNANKCYFTDAGLKHIAHLKLTHLNMGHINGITNKGLTHIVQMPLIDLNIAVCLGITDDGLKYLMNIPLNNLNINFCYKITDDGLKYLVNMPLNELDICNCYNITDIGLNHLVKLPLKRLNFTMNHNFTHDAMAKLKNVLLFDFSRNGMAKLYDAS